jgi:dTDP-4-amino-4,6-dideoxygalactose transaminase
VQKDVLNNQFLSLKKKQQNRIKKSKYYYDNLKKNNDIIFPQKIFSYKNIYIDFPVIIKKRKKELFNYLMNNNIDVKGYYYSNCGNNIIYKKDCYISKINNSAYIAKKIMMLPVNENFKKKDQDRVIFHINKFIYNNK